MTKVEKYNQLTNRIEVEESKEWNKVNHKKIEKWQAQMDVITEMIENSPKMQEEYETVNGCPWE